MKILFVCTGNTCRSPMALGLARLYFPVEHELASAGIHAYTGDAVSRHASEALKEKGIDISRHRATQLIRDSVEHADLILTMTHAQQDLLTEAYPEFQDKIKQIGDWAGLRKEITDPWQGSLATYRQCAADIEEIIKAGVTRSL
ncbi:low molecular weight protein arginine phosphatase [Dehalobacter sp. DCM]|uniref:low molecular weight protein arginine phosphatase n=1 Tax=Dehalobacter sp. DCM TaxID=2907827 RepID=UPI00308150BC|nr:low molecular weight protein arginine phosphatase [Dehalobacter sp. DCM]